MCKHRELFGWQKSRSEFWRPQEMSRAYGHLRTTRDWCVTSASSAPSVLPALEALMPPLRPNSPEAFPARCPWALPPLPRPLASSGGVGHSGQGPGDRDASQNNTLQSVAHDHIRQAGPAGENKRKALKTRPIITPE